MRTVPTLCALASGISASAVGLNLATEHPVAVPPPHKRDQRRTPSDREMSATTTLPPSTFAFSFSTPDRVRSIPKPPLFARSQSENAKSLIRTTFETGTVHRGSSAGSMSGDARLRRETSEQSRTSTPGTPHSGWLRRVSTGVSTSRESSRPSSSRPASGVLHLPPHVTRHFSYAGSTTPMLLDDAPPPLARNRLVKRSASTRSISSSAALSSGSKIPRPNFGRPATSHQRSVTLQEQVHKGGDNVVKPGSGQSDRLQDIQWRHYFTPRVANTPTSSMGRSFSGIPNPIRRVYPDRRYIPTLVSAGHAVKRAELEVDGSLDFDFDFDAGTTSFGAAAPSQEPRRSFSIGDLLSTGPSPLWKRPNPKSRLPSGKLVRGNGRRIVSAPQPAMGAIISASRGDFDRPVKRREVETPVISSPSLYAASSATRASEVSALQEIELNLGEQTTISPVDLRHPAGASPSPSLSSPPGQRRIASATETSSASYQPRLSAAASEITSTTSSENGYRSVGDASTDYQSDNFFDSFPTRTTQSSGGKRGPPIETIFDESPPSFSSGRSTKLKDFLNASQTHTPELGEKTRYSTIEEEESITTPVRSLNGKSLASSPHINAVPYNVFSSSPPPVHEVTDMDDLDWAVPEDPTSSPMDDTALPDALDRSQEEFFPVGKSLPYRLGPFAKSQNPSSTASTPQRNGATDRTTTIFDWSEAQPSPSQNQSPPRPKTVHGKKDPETRGSRQSGRRAPSAMHARSHSVPVVPDVDGKRSTATANKFGTWGVGSKAVTEDWNEDFDFEEDLPELMGAAELEERRIDSGHEMFVPKSIREQQQNVVANIGLLREWGLLIEELKELRVRAVALEMLTGPHARAWSEVDAMIALADQESEEDTLEPRRSPPSSPGFDYDAFDEPVREAVHMVRARAESIRTASPALASKVNGTSNLRFEENNTPLQSLLARPRKDSEAVARSVIEALQNRRSVSDPTALQPVQAKKVPFDTATLRHIVPYVNKLKRQVKDALRETEGLYTSPQRRSGLDMNGDIFDDDDDDEHHDDDDGPFGSIFHDPVGRQARRLEAVTDHDEPFT